VICFDPGSDTLHQGCQELHIPRSHANVEQQVPLQRRHSCGQRPLDNVLRCGRRSREGNSGAGCSHDHCHYRLRSWIGRSSLQQDIRHRCNRKLCHLGAVPRGRCSPRSILDGCSHSEESPRLSLQLVPRCRPRLSRHRRQPQRRAKDRYWDLRDRVDSRLLRRH
jgi:hypothetical protein